jgi:hypothetical protein
LYTAIHGRVHSTIFLPNFYRGKEQPSYTVIHDWMASKLESRRVPTTSKETTFNMGFTFT